MESMLRFQDEQFKSHYPADDLKRVLVVLPNDSRSEQAFMAVLQEAN